MERSSTGEIILTSPLEIYATKHAIRALLYSHGSNKEDIDRQCLTDMYRYLNVITENLEAVVEAGDDYLSAIAKDTRHHIAGRQEERLVMRALAYFAFDATTDPLMAATAEVMVREGQSTQ